MTEVLSNPDCKWMKKTKEIMNDYSIQDEELTGCRDEVRNDIHVGMYVKFYEKMTQEKIRNLSGISSCMERLVGHQRNKQNTC